MMIIFAIIAYGEKYHELSLRAIDSIKKYASDSKIHIVTDNIEFYSSYTSDVLTVSKGKDYTGDLFKPNLKYQSLLKANELTNTDDIIIMLDADCYLTSTYNEEAFQSINYGLNAPLGKDSLKYHIDIFKNSPCTIEKILAHNNDKLQQYYVFREACLIFKVDPSIHNFIKTWECGYEFNELNNLSQFTVTIDVQMAALKSNYPIFNISDTSIIEMMRMTDVNGHIGLPLN